MAKRKKNNFIEVFKIFFSSIKTYFLYLDRLAAYMAFPVFGQMISIIILFSLTYYFNTNIETLRAFPFFAQNDNKLLTVFFIILFPFIFIFLRAFYKYLIAFESLNIMFFTLSKNKKAKNTDFKSNDKSIERRLFGYVILMLVVTLMLVVPPLFFVSPVIWVFLCLAFQVYALEPDVSPFGAIARSMKLTARNFIPTSVMLLLCFVSTYWFLTELFVWALDKLAITHFFINTIIPFINLLPIDAYNQILSIANINIDSVTIAKSVIESTVSFILIAYTLPFRCCCFTELYKLYDFENIKEYSKESEEIIKRASGKKRKN